MKKQVIKKPKAAAPKNLQKGRAVKVKLKKSDPDYFKKIGQISAKKRKLDSTYFSDMAKKSHPANNPDADRDGYHGGRKKKTE